MFYGFMDVHGSFKTYVYIYISIIPCFEIESSAMAVLKSAWPQDFEVFEHSETWWMVLFGRNPHWGTVLYIRCIIIICIYMMVLYIYIYLYIIICI